MKADLDVMMTDLGTTITFEGEEYPAIVGDIEHNRRDVQMAGFFDRYAVMVLIRLADFATAPGVDDVIEYEGQTYRIRAVRDSATRLWRTLICEEDV